jgi:hypothetical protein
MLAVLLALFSVETAHAIQGTASEIEVSDGVIGLVTPLGVVQGGTGLATITPEAVLVGDGTNAVKEISTATAGEVLTFTGGVVVWGAVDLDDPGDDSVTGTLALANGGTNLSTAPADDQFLVGTAGAALEYTTATPDCVAADEALTYNATTNDFGCHAIASTSANAIIGVSTNMDLTASSTVYMAPGVSDTTEARGASIAPVGMSLDSLRCVASGTVGGTGITITMADGVCGGALTDSTTQFCTIGAAASPPTCTEAGAAEAITAGQCYSIRAVSTASANDVVVSCNLERTS